jgi:hypothetical protein
MRIKSYLSNTLKTSQLFRTAFALCAVVTITVASAAGGSQPPETPVTTPQEQAVLQPIENLFDGMAKPDKTLIAAQMMPEGTATLYRNGEFTQMTLNELVERLGNIISGPDKFEERIHNPSIHIDDKLAEAWTPYEALKNGRVDHCGTNVFILVFHDGQWLIASVADTFRSNCSPQ